jgi:hypothetical protein
MEMDFVEKLNSFIDDVGNKIWTGAYKVGEKFVNYVILNDSLPAGTNVLGKVGIDPAANGVLINGSLPPVNISKTPVNLITKPLTKVCCFGDSFSHTSTLLNKYTAAWYPMRLNAMFAKDAVKTGDNLFVSPYTLDGAVESSGEFTLTSGSTKQNPLVYRGFTAVTGKYYLVSAEIDTTNCAGQQLALFAQSYTGSDYNERIIFCGHNVSTGGYKTVCAVFSVDQLNIGHNGSSMYVGAEIIGDGTDAVGKVKNIQVFELSTGVAVCRRGAGGWKSSDGLAAVYTQVLAFLKPDICIVEFGINDLLASVPLDTYLANLKSIVYALEEYGVYPIIANIPQRTAELDATTQEWNAASKILADELRIGYWDLHKSLNSLSYLDYTFHPTVEGNYRMAIPIKQILQGKAVS